MGMRTKWQSLMPLMKLLEENEMPAIFWYGPGQERLVGIPYYKGFDIDIGEMFEVSGRSVALHDFRTLLMVNPDNHLYREHHA